MVWDWVQTNNQIAFQSSVFFFKYSPLFSRVAQPSPVGKIKVNRYGSVFQCIYLWLWPRAKNSGHQDYYMSSRNPCKLAFCHCYPDGRHPNTYLLLMQEIRQPLVDTSQVIAGFLNNQYELIRYILSMQIRQCRPYITLNIWDTLYINNIYIIYFYLDLYIYIFIHVLLHHITRLHGFHHHFLFFKMAARHRFWHVESVDSFAWSREFCHFPNLGQCKN